jgi:hypothetical protein
VSDYQEALWGWDPTPGIVSVWADASGCALVWRRLDTGALVCDRARFRPWLLLSSLEFVEHLGRRLVPSVQPVPHDAVSVSELAGPGQLRYRVDAADGRALTAAVLAGARRRLGAKIARLRDLGADHVLSLPPEEQYLVATGRTFFRGMVFDQLTRLTLDLETTGLDARTDRLFLVALCHSDGACETLEADAAGDAGEADLLQRLARRVRELDPDVIENHHLHGFDLPFLFERARRLRVSLELGRVPGVGLRPASRGVAPWASGDAAPSRQRYTLPGRASLGVATTLPRATCRGTV